METILMISMNFLQHPAAFNNALQFSLDSFRSFNSRIAYCRYFKILITVEETQSSKNPVNTNEFPSN